MAKAELFKVSEPKWKRLFLVQNGFCLHFMNKDDTTAYQMPSSDFYGGLAFMDETHTYLCGL